MLKKKKKNIGEKVAPPNSKQMCGSWTLDMQFLVNLVPCGIGGGPPQGKQRMLQHASALNLLSEPHPTPILRIGAMCYAIEEETNTEAHRSHAEDSFSKRWIVEIQILSLMPGACSTVKMLLGSWPEQKMIPKFKKWWCFHLRWFFMPEIATVFFALNIVYPTCKIPLKLVKSLCQGMSIWRRALVAVGALGIEVKDAILLAGGWNQNWS